ncbi:hypothetical protein GEI7407_2478 [Geitlerinema sp. PCC 7407]|nr:hypothetical protein GEI7407_2478 [Geitlerinema sp. PCC 7407]
MRSCLRLGSLLRTNNFVYREFFVKVLGYGKSTQTRYPTIIYLHKNQGVSRLR